MKASLLLLALAAPALASLGGCETAAKDDPAVSACEAYIKATLRSPSTYQRVEVTIGDSVIVEYDAANAYGTPIRGADQCEFALYEGAFRFVRPAATGDRDADTLLMLAAHDADAALGYAGIAPAETSLRPSAKAQALSDCISAMIANTRWRVQPPFSAMTWRVTGSPPARPYAVEVTSAGTMGLVPAQMRCDFTPSEIVLTILRE